MDPRFGAGRESFSSPSAVSDVYFTAQALRAGYIGPLDDMRRGELVHEPVSAREILERELLKQRIREEIIAREIVERRLLEEEVKMELEMERAWAARWFQEDAFPSAAAVPALAEARVPFPHFAPEVGVGRAVAGERLVGDGVFGENLFGERLLPNVPKGRLLKKRLSRPQNNHGNKGSASTPNAKRSGNNAVGIKKRKASYSPGVAQKQAGEPSHSAKQDWSCALCQVSCPRRKVLNHHLQGRKHKARAALMGVGTEAGASSSATRAKKPGTSAKGAGPKKARTNLEGKNPLNEGIGGQPVRKKQKTGASLWCELCKVECTSDTMLASHLGGKKHRAKLASRSKGSPAAPVTAAEKGTAGSAHSNEGKTEFSDESAVAEDRAGMVEGPTLQEEGTDRRGGGEELN